MFGVCNFLLRLPRSHDRNQLSLPLLNSLGRWRCLSSLVATWRTLLAANFTDVEVVADAFSSGDGQQQSLGTDASSGDGQQLDMLPDELCELVMLHTTPEDCVRARRCNRMLLNISLRPGYALMLTRALHWEDPCSDITRPFRRHPSAQCVLLVVRQSGLHCCRYPYWLAVLEPGKHCKHRPMFLPLFASGRFGGKAGKVRWRIRGTTKTGCQYLYPPDNEDLMSSLCELSGTHLERVEAERVTGGHGGLRDPVVIHDPRAEQTARDQASLSRRRETGPILRHACTYTGQSL